MNCFLSSLKDEIYLLICMLNPPNLNASFWLAKILEEYISSAKKMTKLVAKKNVVIDRSSSFSRPMEGTNRWQRVANSPRQIFQHKWIRSEKMGFTTTVMRSGAPTMCAKSLEPTSCKEHKTHMTMRQTNMLEKTMRNLEKS